MTVAKHSRFSTQAFTLGSISIYVQIIIMRYLYLGTEDVVAHCLHQGEEAEARCDGDDQGAGSLQGLCLLWLDFTQERL